MWNCEPAIRLREQERLPSESKKNTGLCEIWSWFDTEDRTVCERMEVRGEISWGGRTQGEVMRRAVIESKVEAVP